MNFFKLDDKNYSSLSNKMKLFDDVFTYPLGKEIFKISHGENYFKFFEKLGDLQFSGFEMDGKLAIVAASVLRTIRNEKVWYLCALKVHPDFRNKKLTTRLVYRNFFLHYLKSRKCYGISMNSENNSNKTLKILKNVKFNFFKSAGEVMIYSLSKEQLSRVIPLIEKYKGKVGSISLKGTKDIILQSTQRPIRLNHLVFNTNDELGSYDGKVEVDDVFMFCSKEGSPLTNELEAVGLTESSTATIIHHGMQSWDWEFINTSEI